MTMYALFTNGVQATDWSTNWPTLMLPTNYIGSYYTIERHLNHYLTQHIIAICTVTICALGVLILGAMLGFFYWITPNDPTERTRGD